jgi:CO/xanthine dehydrogenase Mo-binding subunit
MDTGLGVATTFGQARSMPTWVACVARVRVDRSSGAVAVEKLTIVVDAGTLVHPDGALAQVEGSALWGLSMALYEGSEFVKGQVKDTNLDSYTPLRIGDVPELDIEFIDSTELAEGTARLPARLGQELARLAVVIVHGGGVDALQKFDDSLCCAACIALRKSLFFLVRV